MDNINPDNPGPKKNSDYSQINPVWRLSCLFLIKNNKYVKICIGICLK